MNGYLVTGTNQNSIFLPAAGNWYGTSLGETMSLGYYWSSSLYTESPIYASNVLFYLDGVYRYFDSRYYGESVRPVTE